MIEHKLFPSADARAFTPTAAESDKPGIRGNLADQSLGDWAWKPYRYGAPFVSGCPQRYRFMVTGPRCTCTLAEPVGSSCARHSN